MQVPLISVGILSGKEIEFSFPIKFSSSVGTEISGTQKAIYQDGKIHWHEQIESLKSRANANLGDVVFFVADNKKVVFDVLLWWEM